MALRGKKPEGRKDKRLKMFVYGAAGVGKTWATLQFPKAYVIDTERGTQEYHQRIIDSDSALLESTDPDEVRQEIMALLTTRHDYRTLIIDPITLIYHGLQEKWARVFDKYAKTEKERELQDFGVRYWGRVKSEYKSMQRLLIPLDMNVIITAHQKDMYGEGFVKLGTTFDSEKKDDYFFDLIFQIEKHGERRIARTMKERAEPGKQKFPSEFDWSYDNFCAYYGKDIIERPAEPVAMANPEQVERLNNLVKILNVEDEITNKWLTKAEADSFDQFTQEQIEKCLAALEEKLKGVVQ